MSPEEREVAEKIRPDAAPRDGIGEEDNPIPLWFNVGFYGLIAIGIVYACYYTLSGWSSAKQYRAEVAVAARAAAAAKADLPTENPYRGNAEAVAEGAEVFTTICAACHKPDGSGLVGPSLVDPYWKYGNTDAALFESISVGRPGGMPPWGTQLGTEKIWKALAYLETLPKTDVPGMGAPGVGPAGP